MKISKSGLEYLAILKACQLWGKGTICVFREHDGKPAVLKLENQRSFNEWDGCFSILWG